MRRNMNRLWWALPLSALTTGFGCPADRNEHQAQLHVTCVATGKVLDGNSQVPAQGYACEPGGSVTFTYDNMGGYNYVLIYAVARDSLEFYVPPDKLGKSVAIQPSGSGVPLPDTFMLPQRTRDIIALFSREPLNSAEVDKRTREVTLRDLPGTQVRVPISLSHGPLE
jgi:hypothetical protein